MGLKIRATVMNMFIAVIMMLGVMASAQEKPFQTANDSYRSKANMTGKAAKSEEPMFIAGRVLTGCHSRTTGLKKFAPTSAG